MGGGGAKNSYYKKPINTSTHRHYCTQDTGDKKGDAQEQMSRQREPRAHNATLTLHHRPWHRKKLQNVRLGEKLPVPPNTKTNLTTAKGHDAY